MSWQDYSQPPHQPYWGGPPTRNSGTAVAALVLGICGFVVCPLICSIAAIICGNIALNEIDRSNGQVTGRDMAKAGLILGWVGVALCVLGLLLIVGLIAFGAWAVDEGSNYEYELDTQISMIRAVLRA
jgi:hypothetical protein